MPRRAAAAPTAAPSAAPPAGRPIGPHLPARLGLLRTLERVREIGAGALQIFSDNPSAWRRRPEPPSEVDEFRARAAATRLGPMSVHAPYLINLAGPSDSFWERSVETLAHELRVAPRYGASLVVVHIGSHLGTGLDAGLRRLGAGIRSVLEQVPHGPSAARLVLENGAGAPNGVGSSIAELAAVLEAAAAAGGDVERVAFCLDTAHLWGAGVDLTDPDVLDRLLQDVDARLEPGRLALIHLNDSRAPLGSRLDRHEHIGAGRIGERGMAAVLAHPRLRAVPMMLEVPGADEGWDRVNMDRIRLLLDGQPLPALPPEAFQLRGRRARRRGTAVASEGAEHSSEGSADASRDPSLVAD